MVYRRFRKYKKVGRRKPKSGMALARSYGSKAGALAYKAYRGVKYIKSLINVEKKFFDVADNNTRGTTPVVISLSNIAQGNDFNNRGGNSILLQSILTRLYIKHDMNKQGADAVRCILFRDNDQRGTDPAASDLLETGSGFTYMTAALNHTVGSRFDVIHDKTYTVSDQKQTINIKWFKKLNSHVKYTATTGNDAAAYEGALFMLIVSDENTTPPTVNLANRIRFTDN